MNLMITTVDALYTACWQTARLSEAVELLAQRSGLKPRGARFLDQPPDVLQSDDRLEQWMQFAAAQLAIEAEPVEVAYREINDFIMHAAPALIRITRPDHSQPLFLALLTGGSRVVVLTPELKTVRIAASMIANVMRQPFFAMNAVRDRAFFELVGMEGERRERVREALYQEMFGALQLSAGWILRFSPGAPMLQQVHTARLERPIIAILIAQIALQGLTLIGWSLISRQALQGTFDGAWLMAWGLLLFTAIPIQMWMATSASAFSTTLGSILKQRLIYGTLSLQPEAIRHEGIGHFLGRVMDSNVVESTSIANVFMMIMALIQVASAAAIFVSSGSWQLAVLLMVWTLLIGVTSVTGYGSARAWYNAYRQMTNYLVEAMVGHRTRLAQQPSSTWHSEEDKLLDQYLQLSQRTDVNAVVQAAINGSWLIAGLIGIALVFVSSPMSLQTLAISLGGVLLAQGALQIIQSTLNSTQSALQSWQQVKPLFDAARKTVEPSSVLLLDNPTDKPAETNGARKPLLAIKNLSFRYREHGRWVIRDCNLTIYTGDRLLLEGPSGGGKSTLATLIAGLRQPASGLLLLRGYDQKSISLRDWRRKIVIAPQFHENHIFTETFAFNLLMGRRYPPTQSDLQEANLLCAELGLADLLNRMPSGFQQMVGESGWQLSHGERSRVFIARALLQGADVIILDESFGALDAETLQRAMECVLRRAKTLIVIAHP